MQELCTSNLVLDTSYAQMSFSTYIEGHNTGKIDGAQGWSPAERDLTEPWMQIDLGRVIPVAGVVTQGRRSQDYTGSYGMQTQWVTRYRVKVSTEGQAWTTLGGAEGFVGNTDNDSRVERLFDKPVRARFVRIMPIAFNMHPTMRAAVVACAQDCIAGSQVRQQVFDSKLYNEAQFD